MLPRETILAVLGAGISLAGLLLVFAGFLFTKVLAIDGSAGNRYRWFARATAIPVLTALGLAWLSVMALECNQWANLYLMTSLKVTLGITALFAIVGIFTGTP